VAQLPREAEGAPSLEVFKTRLDGGPGQPELVGGCPAHSKAVELGGL